MPYLSRCPACNQEMVVRDLSLLEELYRCPHCAVEFSVQSIREQSFPLPPEAIAVHTIAAGLEQVISATDDSIIGQHVSTRPTVADTASVSLPDSITVPSADSAEELHQSGLFDRVSTSAGSQGENQPLDRDVGDREALSSEVTGRDIAGRDIAGSDIAGSEVTDYESADRHVARRDDAGSKAADEREYADDVDDNEEGDDDVDTVQEDPEQTHKSAAQAGPIIIDTGSEYRYRGTLSADVGPGVIMDSEALNSAIGSSADSGTVRRSSSGSPKHALLNLAGIVIFGVVGLIIGDLILLFVFGPRRDILNLRKVLPGWIYRGNDSAGDDNLEEDDRAAGDDDAASDSDGIFAKGFSKSSQSIWDKTDAEKKDPNQDAQQQSKASAAATNQQSTNAVEPPVKQDPKKPPRGLKSPPTISSDDLRQSLVAANQALGCPYCGGTGIKAVPKSETKSDSEDAETEDKETDKPETEPEPTQVAICPICEGKQKEQPIVAVFEALSGLAECVTFVRADKGDKDYEARRQAVKGIVERTGSDLHRLEGFGRLAAQRLKATNRDNSGVILAGTVASSNQREDQYWVTKVVLFGEPTTVDIISNRPANPPFAPRDRVLVLGHIVAKPAENIHDFKGEQKQVVWGGYSIKVDLP